MKKVVRVNSADVIRDLAVRVKNNEEGVKSFLSRAGIDTNENVTLEQLQQLLQLNPGAFQELVVFLYGDRANADEQTLNFTGNLVSSIVGTAGSTLASIFGQTDQSNVIALQQAETERQQRMIYVILGCVAVIGVVIAIVAMRHGSASHVTVAK